MKLKYRLPLFGFVVQTLIIGYGFVIPNSVIAGVNQLTIGLWDHCPGHVFAYVAGIHLVMKDPPST